jgi:hypothetical protein
MAVDRRYPEEHVEITVAIVSYSGVSDLGAFNILV